MRVRVFSPEKPPVGGTGDTDHTGGGIWVILFSLVMRIHVFSLEKSLVDGTGDKYTHWSRSLASTILTGNENMCFLT